MTASVKVTTLDNGLVVATDTVETVKTVSIGLWNRIGSRYEDKTNNGVAHFLEHMVFKGTKTRSALDIAQQIENVGGYLNAYTGNEMTAYYARVMQEDAALGLDIISDLLLNPTLPQDELEKERGVILQEIGMYMDDPQSLVGLNAQRIAYGDHPLGWSILGPEKLIETMPRDTLQNFIDTYYAPNNMVLSASGAVNHERVVDQAQKIFGHLKPKAKQSFLSAKYEGGDHRQQKDLEQTNMILAFDGLNYHDPDYYVMAVLSVIMGDGMSSRLFQEIREKRGLVYSVGTFIDAYADAGLFGVHAGTGPQSMAELMPVLCDSLITAAGTFTDEELSRAKAQFRAQNLMALEGTFRRADRLAQNIIKYGRPVALDDTLAKIDAVTKTDLDRIARRIFNSTPTFATVGPQAAVESYEQIEKRLAA